MRRIRFVIALSTLLFASIVSAQQASTTSVPNLIRYSGALKDASPASTAVGVTFAIYKQREGGAPIWMETQNVTLGRDGQYSVLLGSTTATGLPDGLFSQQEERWLGVQLQGQAEQPRVLLVSVPYAFKAHEAETLAGLPVSAFLRAPTTDPSSQTNSETHQSESLGTKPGFLNGRGSTNYLPIWQNPYILGNSVLYQAGGNVGIGTITPQAKLDVNGGINTSGMFTGSGAGLTGIQFSQISGLLGSSQLGGSYSNALTLSNSSNVFYGDGSHLTGIPAPVNHARQSENIQTGVPLFITLNWAFPFPDTNYTSTRTPQVSANLQQDLNGVALFQIASVTPTSIMVEAIVYYQDGVITLHCIGIHD